MTQASPSLGRGGAAPTAEQVTEAVRRLLPLAAAAAAAVLALTSTGSMVVAAALLGVAVADRRAAAAALLAVAAVGVRFGTASFDDLAGIQSVLGNAVEVGPATGAASAWAAAVALLLGAAPATHERVLAVATAVAAGGFAAALAAGQGPGGELWMRIAATGAGVVLAGVVVAADRRSRRWRAARPWLAVGAGLVAVVSAAWP